MEPDPKQKLTASQAAKIIGTTRQGVNTLILRGRIPATLVVVEGVTRYWVVTRGDLDTYVANRRNAWGHLPREYKSTVEG